MKGLNIVKPKKLIGALSASAIALALVGFVMVGGAAADDESKNVAPLAEPTASYTAGWNGLASLNDDVIEFSGHGSMWGTCCVYPATEWTMYTWEYPVTISKSAFWFWNDMDGSANVEVPASWNLEYLDPVTDTYIAIPDIASYPINKTGESSVEFAPVTTTSLRANFTASRRADDSGNLAMGATEWKTWGSGGVKPVIPVDPNGPIDIAEVHLPTEIGEIPSLPDTVTAMYEDGRVIEAPVSWGAITQEMVSSERNFTITGTAKDIVESVTAHIYVRDGDPGDAVWVDNVSAVTLAGTAPILPKTVTVEFEDGTKDSRIAVVWDAITPEDYATEGTFFTIAGTVAGTTLSATATIWVEAPADDEDTVPPVLSFSVEPAMALSGWYLEPPTVTVTARDNQDPNPAVSVRVDQGGSAEYTGPILVTGEGPHKLVAQARDASDNVAELDLSLQVDTLAPITNASISGLTDLSAEVTLEATDAAKGSGVQRTLWATGPTIDSVTMWATYVEGEPFTITREDSETFAWFYSQDVAGHQEVTKSLPIPAKDESAGPAVAIAIDPASPAANAAGWHNGAVNVVVTATDDVDPTPAISVSIDGGAYEPYVAPIEFGVDGTRIVSAKAVNAAGKESAITTHTVNVDSTPPVAEAEKDETSRTVTLSGLDQTSGIAAVQYRFVPSQAWVDYLGPVTVGDAAVTVEYRAKDLADNVSAPAKVEFGEKATEPTPTPSEPTPGPTPTPVPGNPRIDLSATQVDIGGKLTVTGRGFLPGSSLELWLHSANPAKVATVSVRLDGTFSQEITIAKGTSPGEHRIRALTPATGVAVWSNPFTIGTDQGLGVTGAATAALTTVAIALIAGGIVLARRRRSVTVQ